MHYGIFLLPTHHAILAYKALMCGPPRIMIVDCGDLRTFVFSIEVYVCFALL